MTIPLNIPITEIPIACTLDDGELATRRQRILGGLWRKVEKHQELTDGYAFQFPNSDDIAQEILSFILIERQCCSFFQMELAFKPDNGPIWLHLRGADGVKKFIETELVMSDEI